MITAACSRYQSELSLRVRLTLSESRWQQCESKRERERERETAVHQGMKFKKVARNWCISWCDLNAAYGSSCHSMQGAIFVHEPWGHSVVSSTSYHVFPLVLTPTKAQIWLNLMKCDLVEMLCTDVRLIAGQSMEVILYVQSPVQDDSFFSSLMRLRSSRACSNFPFKASRAEFITHPSPKHSNEVFMET